MKRLSRRDLERELRERILVLDGALGTSTSSELVARIHRDSLEAGADIISTHTCNAEALHQADRGTAEEAREVSFAAARLARAAADEFTAGDGSRPRFVAGVLGPPGSIRSAASAAASAAAPAGSGDLTFDRLAAAYREQAIGLWEGGVDILRVETIADALHAKAALFAIRGVLDEREADLPVWISAAISERGRISSGQTMEAFWIAISHAEPLCVGLNCGADPLGGPAARALEANLAELSRTAEARISVHPNVGGSPQETAAVLRGWAENGWVNIVGGRCGTRPEHIAAIARAVEGLAPRRMPSPPVGCRLSGLEPLEIRPGDPFVRIGERTNVTGSARFARLIKEGRRADALAVARQQIRSGARIIDVNLDDALLDSAAEMTAFLELVSADPDIARVPVMIDSADWEVIAAGLKCLRGKGIVNSISLQEGQDEFIRRARLIRRSGAAVVALAIDPQGQAESRERKLEIGTRQYRILVERVGFPPQDVILDPCIFAVGTGMPEHADYAVAYIEACRAIKKTLPRCLISGGISNLSFAYRGNDTVRAALHGVFLHHAIAAGMDMGIVNPAQLRDYADIPEELREAAEDVVLNRRPDATTRLLGLARRVKSVKGDT